MDYWSKFDRGSFLNSSLSDFNDPESLVRKGLIYHGTSLEALEGILNAQVMKTPIQLINEGNLVWGELKDEVKGKSLSELRGQKFMSRKAMVELGMISPEDEGFYDFGHAYDIWFAGSPLRAMRYAPEDSNEQAIVGIRTTVYPNNEEKFIDTNGANGSNGILHEGQLYVRVGLKQLFVPDHLKEEYEKRTQGSYLLSVWPMSRIQKN